MSLLSSDTNFMKENKINTKTQSTLDTSLDLSDDEIDLNELISVIWKAKILILLVTTLFAVASIIYAVNQPNIYMSEVLLAPSEQQSASGLGGLGGQFGGLASLAGISLGSGGNSKNQMALEVLKSRQFTKDFIQKHDILPELMAAESWSMQNNKLIYDEELFNSQNREWLREVSPPSTPQPSMQESIKAFKKVLNVSTDKETGMVTISVEHVSPFIAQQWVSWLVEDINLTMKEREVAEARRSTEFLYEQLEQTEIADIREVLYKLIEEQMKTIMFAKVRDEYVFKTIDAAIVPEEKLKPKRALIVILGTLFGSMICTAFVLIRHFTRGSNS